MTVREYLEDSGSEGIAGPYKFQLHGYILTGTFTESATIDVTQVLNAEFNDNIKPSTFPVSSLYGFVSDVVTRTGFQDSANIQKLSLDPNKYRLGEITYYCDDVCIGQSWIEYLAQCHKPFIAYAPLANQKLFPTQVPTQAISVKDFKVNFDGTVNAFRAMQDTLHGCDEIRLFNRPGCYTSVWLYYYAAYLYEVDRSTDPASAFYFRYPV